VSIQPSRTPPPPPPRPPRQPAVNLPRTVGVLIALNVGVYILTSVMPPNWEGWVLWHLGFVPARYSVPGAFDWAALVSPLSHQFLHGGPIHLLINMVMLAAFGSGVERVLGGRRMLALYFLTGIAGAFFHWLIYPELRIPMVGASGAISGLFGAVLRLLGKHPQVGGGFVRMLPVAVIWIGMSVFVGFTGMPGTGEAQVAWAAHVGGFLLALLFFDLFAIGAWPRRVR